MSKVKTRKGQTYAHSGRELTITQWCADPAVQALEINTSLLGYRLGAGWSIEEALTTARGAKMGTNSHRDVKPEKASAAKAPKKSPASRAATSSPGTRDASLSPALEGALAAIEERYDELRRDLTSLAVAGNALCDALGIDRRWEDA